MQKEKVSVIVTSAGTASAISVIKALNAQTEIEVHIIAVDVDPMAAGLFLADEYEIVPVATHSNYIDTLIKIAKRTGANVLIPIYSKEIRLISENSNLLRASGLQTMLSPMETIDIVNDKRAMQSAILELGIKAPHLYTKEELQNLDPSKLPLFVKPNTGSSSSGAELVKKESRVKELIMSDKDIIFQTYVDAEEVTVDVLCNEKSEAIVIAPRIRLSIKSGQSVKGKTISNSRFLETVQRICGFLKVRGVCNIQFFIKNGELIFIELNPRFAAGGLMLTVAAGANIPLLLLKLILGIRIESSECQTRPDVGMTRYWQEIIIDNKQK